MTSASEISPWQRRNAELIAAYACERSVPRRNAIVQANLPLVWQAARRESQRSGHPFEDLSQVGCLGLIKAVEAFDPQRGASLSSAAMPWIIGAMRQYIRDRGQPLRGGRSLRELMVRALAAQRQRAERQLAPLSEAELAQVLGCSVARWRQAQELRLALRMASLDQPQLQSDGEAACLRDLLVDPRSEESYGRAMRAERRRLLWRSLRQLERDQRRLLLGRVLQGLPWAALGAPLGLSGKAAQRRFHELLDELRRQLMPTLLPA